MGEMWIAIIVATIGAGAGIVSSILSLLSVKASEKNKTEIEKTSNDNRIRVEELSKKLESKNGLKLIYYRTELDTYSKLMERLSVYRWVILEPELAFFDRESFEYEAWDKNYWNSLNDLRDCMDINCAFISKVIDDKLEAFKYLGSGTHVAVMNFKCDNKAIHEYSSKKLSENRGNIIALYAEIRDAVRSRVEAIYTDEGLKSLS